MKRMKKLLALALSGVMALSCVVTAGAAATPADDYTGGSQSGKGMFESVLPDGVVKIVLPAQEDGTFDMILDPHGLIKDTGAARYEEQDFEEGTEDAPIYLFFHNLAEGAEYAYSSKSDPYSIINKSSFDVDMTVSVEVEKGAAGESFDLVAADAVADAEGAAMYLGLQVVDAEALYAEGEDDTIQAVEDAETTTTAVALADDADKVAAAPNATVAGDSETEATATAEKAMISGTPTVTFAAGVSAEEKTAIIAALTNSRAAVEASEGVAAVTAIPKASIDVTYTADDADIAIEATIPTPTDDATLFPAVFTIADATVSIEKTGKTFDATDSDTYTDAYFSLPVLNADSKKVATVRGKIDAAKVVATEGGVAHITFIKNTTPVAPLSSATYSDTINAFSAAYGNVWKADENGGEDENGNPKGEYILAYFLDDDDFTNDTATAKQDEMKSAVEGAPAKGIQFNLVGAINSSDDWDDLAGADNNIDIAVIWDISESAGNGTPKVKNKAPTLSVGTAVNTASSPASQTLTLNWTAGTGDYEGYAPKTGSGGAKYYKANATSTTALTVATPSEGAITISMNAASRASTTTGHVVVFTCADADKEDLEIEFPTGWNAG